MKIIRTHSIGIVLAKKRTRTIRDISESVDESGVIEIVKSYRSVIDILPYSPTSNGDKITESVRSVHPYDIFRNDHISERFTHLFPGRSHESVNEDIPRSFHIG